MIITISTYHFAVKLPLDVNDNINLQPEIANIRELLVEARYDVLSEIPVSVDCTGKIINRFSRSLNFDPM